MKTILFLAFVIFLVGLGIAQAGIFDSLATRDWTTKESKAFKVEAYGFDFRVYEWVTESDPNTICTIAIGNSSSAPYMGLHCFQKQKEENE